MNTLREKISDQHEMSENGDSTKLYETVKSKLNCDTKRLMVQRRVLFGQGRNKTAESIELNQTKKPEKIP